MKEIFKLKELCRLKTGKTPPTKNKNYFDGGINWLTPSDFKTKYVKSTERTLSDLAIEKGKGRLVVPNSLFITCIGNIGKVIINKQPCSSNQQITALEIINKDRLFVEYLYYWFNYNAKILQFKANNAVVPIINNGTLGKIKIPLPNLETQKAIAAQLDAADALRQKDQELLEHYDLLAQSIFIEMFGDPVLNEKGWDIIKGEKRFTFSSGKYNPTKNLSPSYLIPVYGGNGITGYFNKSLIDYSTIVVGRVGAYCGSVHITEKDSWVTDNAIYIKKFKNKDNLLFTYYFFKNYDLNRFADYSGQPKITQEPLREMFFFDIPIELQTQFAEKIKNIEAQKVLVQQQAAQSERLFQALLQESFMEK